MHRTARTGPDSSTVTVAVPTEERNSSPAAIPRADQSPLVMTRPSAAAAWTIFSRGLVRAVVVGVELDLVEEFEGGPVDHGLDRAGVDGVGAAVDGHADRVGRGGVVPVVR